MKLLLIISSLFLLVSCQSRGYIYRVEGIGCRNSQVYTEYFKWSYAGYDEHTPYLSGNVLMAYSTAKDGSIFPLEIDMNICDFSYTREEIR